MGMGRARQLGSGQVPGEWGDTSGETMDQRLSCAGAGAGPWGTCMALTETPPTCPPHPSPANSARWGCTALGHLGV